jgi:hypothetical protein
VTHPLPRTLLSLLPLALLALALGCPAEFEEQPARGVLQVLIDPAHPVLAVGGEIKVHATALYADGTAQDVTEEVHWKVFSGDTFVDIIGTQAGNTRLFGVQAGHAQLFAIFGESVSEVVVVEVTDGQPLNGYPNLDVIHFDATVAGGKTTYAVDVVNEGDAAAGGFWVDLFRNPEQPPEAWTVGDAYVWVEELAPGEVAYLDFELALTPQGAWMSYVLVDGYEMIDEPYESDNLAGPLVVE